MGDILRIGCVGAGPGTLFFVMGLLNWLRDGVSVDVVETLPTPFGLLRGGVAPDHEDVKRAYGLMLAKVLAAPQVRFWGNVPFGTTLSRDDMRATFDLVVYGSGSAAGSREGITGERLANSFTGSQVAGWYNSNPMYHGLKIDLSGPRVSTAGVGNVQADIARILASDVDRLRKTDISDVALALLAESRIEEIVVNARRGPAQLTMTPPEIKELGEVADVYIKPEQLVLDPISEALIQNDSHRKAAYEAVCKLASHQRQGGRRKILFDFCSSRREIFGGPTGVSEIEWERNRLVPDPRKQGRDVKAEGTGEIDRYAASLSVASVGYRVLQLSRVPFDPQANRFQHSGGWLMEAGQASSDEVVVGWSQTGPIGKLGDTRKVATDMAAAAIRDLRAAPRKELDRRPEAFAELLREKGFNPVTYEMWLKLNEIEHQRGAAQGRPRVKLLPMEMAEHLGFPVLGVPTRS